MKQTMTSSYWKQRRLTDGFELVHHFRSGHADELCQSNIHRKHKLSTNCHSRPSGGATFVTKGMFTLARLDLSRLGTVCLVFTLAWLPWYCGRSSHSKAGILHTYFFIFINTVFHGVASTVRSPSELLRSLAVAAPTDLWQGVGAQESWALATLTATLARFFVDIQYS